MKKDEAVSAVIAVMLILAILATCVAVYTTTYVPGLKQQQEIVHSGEVKLSFERFAADVSDAVSRQKPAVYSEVLTLGGGDILLSPVKSGGTVEIAGAGLGSLSIGSSAPIAIPGVSISYAPSFSAWEPQGYSYANGTVWIVKENKTTPASPLLYAIADGKTRENETVNTWLSSLPLTENGSTAVLQLPRFSVGKHTEITGSSTAVLRLNVSVSDDAVRNIPAGTVVSVVSVNGTETFSHTFGADTALTIRWLNLEVSVE